MTEQLALDELIANYKSKDLIKAKVIIDHLGVIGDTEQRRILFELNKWDDDFALPVLVYLVYRNPEIVDQNANLKKLIIEKAELNPGIIVKNLIKLAPETKVYVKLVGIAKLNEVAPRLRQFLTLTTDKELIQATIKTLGELGDVLSATGISEFLMSEDEQLQTAAAEALVAIGGDKALLFLTSLLERESKKSRMLLTILSEAENEGAIKLLIKTLTSANTVIRNQGKTRLVELGAKTIPFLVSNLKDNDPDLLVHTLNVLLEIGDIDAVKPVRSFLTTKPEDANVRFAAFETLADLPSMKGDYLLATGLVDQDDSIRLAAAKAIDKSISPVLIGGVANMMKNEDAEAIRITKAIIDAQTSRLFISLLENEFFSRIAVDYIAVKAHREIREHYLKVLEKEQRTDLVEFINQTYGKQKTDDVKKVICAVDDSKMILRIYLKILNEIGFEPILFEKPRECLDWLESNRPVALFTDLNMPEINGMELVKTIRKKIDKETLPIVMVTTQQKGKDVEEWEKIGLNRIISKPFDRSAIQSALESLSIDVN